MWIEIESKAGSTVYIPAVHICAMEIMRSTRFPGVIEYTIYLANRHHEYVVSEAEFNRVLDELRSLERPAYALTTLGRAALIGRDGDDGDDDYNELDEDSDHFGLEFGDDESDDDDDDDDDGPELEPALVAPDDDLPF